MGEKERIRDEAVEGRTLHLQLIAQQRTRRGNRPRPHPANAAGMVPIVSRFSIRKQVPRLDYSRKGRYRLLRVVTSTSV